MKPIDRSFENIVSFPFHMAYKNTIKLQHELPEHLHDWYEIVYIYRGKGTFFIDHTFYDMQQGDVFAIPGNTIHRAMPEDTDPITSTAVYFNPALIQNASFGDAFSYLKLFDQSKRRNQFNYALQREYQQKIDHCLAEIWAEYQNKDTGYENALLIGLHMLLLYLNRYSKHEDLTERVSSSQGTGWIEDTLIYIDTNLHQPLNINMLAQKASVSPAHFSRVFKQILGRNVTAYITTKKILLAKEKLRHTHHKVDVIAQQCGFQSMPHFYRTFQKYVRMTPANYRKKDLD